MPPSRAIGYQMERLLGPCPVTTPHCVWWKPCGNGEGGAQYPTVPMHKVTEFGEICTKFARISYEFTRFPSKLHSPLPRISYEIRTNFVRISCESDRIYPFFT